MEFGADSGISWTMCKQSAPRSGQATTPTPHHSIFTGRMLFLMPNQQCQSNEGTKHWRHITAVQFSWQQIHNKLKAFNLLYNIQTSDGQTDKHVAVAHIPH